MCVKCVRLSSSKYSGIIEDCIVLSTEVNCLILYVFLAERQRGKISAYEMDAVIDHSESIVIFLQ